jgi:RNA polymerase sigma factor (sigma-70 family)
MPDDLAAEISRGQELDQSLAQRLGQPEPQRTHASGTVAERLERHTPLPEATERRLVEAARRGDHDARARLVEAYLPLISGLARTYRSGQLQRQELLQEGVVGLLRALERFEPERGVPFWGYAVWWVRQAMQQLVAEITRPFVLSDRALRHLSRLKQAHREASHRSGREPTRAELAAGSGLELEQVDDLLATERARSLDAPVAGREGEVGTFGELLVDPLAEGEYERVLAAIEVEELHDLLAGLSDRERHVLGLRFGLQGPDRSLREVGELLGISGERVRQIENRALGKLAAVMSPPDEALTA